MKTENKKSTPLVSVIIPTYNCQEYIKQTISSVLDQRYKNFEIIVIDDGSTDRTSLELYSVKKKIKYIYQPRKGVSVARNCGIQIARGKYMAFLDADDVWYPEKLEMQVSLLDRFPQVGGIFCDFSRIDSKGVILNERSIRQYYAIFRERNRRIEKQFSEKVYIDSKTLEVKTGISANLYYGNIFKSLFWGNFIPTPSLVVRKESIESVGGFDPGLRTQEDYELWLRLSMINDFAYLDYPLLSIRKRDNQLTADKRKEEIAVYSLEIVKKYMDEATRRLGKLEVGKRIAERYRTLGLVYLGMDSKERARSAFIESFRNNKLSISPIYLYLWSFLPSTIAIRLKNKVKTMMTR